MDLENQKRVLALAEHGKENIVVLLGGADAEASGMIAETVIAGEYRVRRCMTGVQLGLPTFHILEPEIKQEIDPAVYEQNISMMEMVLPVDEIVKEVSSIRKKLLT